MSAYLDLNDSVNTDTYVPGLEYTTDEYYQIPHNISNVTHDHYQMWTVYNLPSILFLTINLVIGIVGNCVVIYVYGFCLKDTPMNSFVVSLGVLDMVTCCVVMPLMILHDLLPYLFITNTTCKVLHFFFSSTIIASSLTLVTIAVDRYRRICRPLSNHLSVTQVRITTIVLVTVAAVTCTPVIIMAGALIERYPFVDSDRKHCYLETKYINSVYIELFYSYKSVVILLTIIITVFCYFRIWFKSHVPSITGDGYLGGRRMSVRTVSAKPKIKPNVKKMFMITLLFIFSFLPSIIVVLVMMYVRNENLHPVAISFVSIGRRTYLVSSTMNPFICWYCNAAFRMHVKNIISKWRASDTSCNSISEATSSKQNEALQNMDFERVM